MATGVTALTFNEYPYITVAEYKKRNAPDLHRKVILNFTHINIRLFRYKVSNMVLTQII